MKASEFRKYGHQFVEWMADYLEQVEDYPVKSQVDPGETFKKIQNEIPIQGESIETIFHDFKKVILPGITHWQSPNFFAYFPANSSPPSILAEMLTATLGVQGMKWETSPSSTELEERMMEWLRDAVGLPLDWSGVIQDTASSATLVSILTTREQKTGYSINRSGFNADFRFRVYCSEETHSSIEKAVKIAGIGRENIVKIPVDELMRLRPDLLQRQIEKDIATGYEPLCIIATLGTTGTTAIDPLAEIAAVARGHNIWLHVDAAYAGSALLLPEYQKHVKGIEFADSFVFNPHKWLFTNFDCSAYFVKDKNALIETFEILPEYLRTQTEGLVANHCDWGIPMGRRFRSLKLWFVLRYYGLEELQKKLRKHIELARWLEEEIQRSIQFEVVAPRNFNLVCFRFVPEAPMDLDEINAMNEKLLLLLNSSGQIYLTHTKVNGIYTLRMVIGQTQVEKHHVEAAWKLIQENASEI